MKKKKGVALQWNVYDAIEQIKYIGAYPEIDEVVIMTLETVAKRLEDTIDKLEAQTEGKPRHFKNEDCRWEADEEVIFIQGGIAELRSFLGIKPLEKKK